MKIPCFPMSSQARYCLCLSSIILFQVSATLMYSITIPCSIFSVSIIYLILAYIHIYPRKVFISKHNFSNHSQIIFFQKVESELDEKTLYLNVPKEEIEEEEEEEEEVLSDEEIRRKY